MEINAFMCFYRQINVCGFNDWTHMFSWKISLEVKNPAKDKCICVVPK